MKKNIDLQTDHEFIITKAFDGTYDADAILVSVRKGCNGYAYPISSKLIQETGRLCDKYAGDLMAIWDEIRNAIETPDNTRHAFAIGIREEGVDNGDHILDRLLTENHSSDYYRQIYAVNVDHSSDDMYVRVEMRDIKADLLYILANIRDSSLVGTVPLRHIWLVYTDYQFDGHGDTEVYAARKDAIIAADSLLSEFQEKGYEIHDDYAEHDTFAEYDNRDIITLRLSDGFDEVEITIERKDVY